jgi:hypothetical protein
MKQLFSDRRNDLESERKSWEKLFDSMVGFLDVARWWFDVVENTSIGGNKWWVNR